MTLINCQGFGPGRKTSKLLQGMPAMDRLSFYQIWLLYAWMRSQIILKVYFVHLSWMELLLLNPHQMQAGKLLLIHWPQAHERRFLQRIHLSLQCSASLCGDSST